MKPNSLFIDNLTNETIRTRSHICVGLDSDYQKLPETLKRNKTVKDALFFFNKEIIDATFDIVSAYKPNIVFYSSYGLEGLSALQQTNKYIKETYPQKIIIADCKRSEMKRSAELVAQEIFKEFYFDALTVTPWFGFDTIEPYQTYEGKAAFVLCHDSNPSAIDIQDSKLEDGRYLYEQVTDLVSNEWNDSGNIFIEAPLTYPEQLTRIEKRTPKDQFFLIAGLGAQGGNIENLDIFKEDKNFIISASRSIIFASQKEDFAQAARRTVETYKDQVNTIIYS